MGKIEAIDFYNDIDHCPGSYNIPEFISAMNYPFIDNSYYRRIEECYVICSSNGTIEPKFGSQDKDSPNRTGGCDLQLAISWLGTDINGRDLTSYE